MKPFFIFLFVISMNFTHSFAQNQPSNGLGQIELTAYYNGNESSMSVEAKNQLENKLNQIISQYGFGGDKINPRFILTAKVSVLTKNIVPGAPPMVAQTLEITFYIGDGIDNKVISNLVMDSKGVGTNETKAYLNAINSINISSQKIKDFIENGKTKIIDYYNVQCDLVIKEAIGLKRQDKYDEAIYKLAIIPQACTDCYKKCLDTISYIYQAKIDNDCKVKFTKAKLIWAKKQDSSSANQVSDIISTIDPSSKCQKEIGSFIESIKQKLEEEQKKEWDFKMKVYNDKLEEDKQNNLLEQQRINSYREVAIEYARNQPKTILYRNINW